MRKQRNKQDSMDWWNAMGIAAFSVSGFTLAFILFLEFLSYCDVL